MQSSKAMSMTSLTKISFIMILNLYTNSSIPVPKEREKQRYIKEQFRKTVTHTE